ncbi:hypothetical protein MmiEs2_11930 [Methanimicrococcus stummii]|uniref:Uncharacterized protein n=1 Tax=Methanimicrococcus stummii TaxID=3028294 RepID=A0AA96VB02_9EURY|nr:hypothetical protein [Methanimicrococcus sp. Es2]WNY28980.1 hypothetical protein MmiEs2_11930 [Methanimicrococcus sp. Es2]
MIFIPIFSFSFYVFSALHTHFILFLCSLLLGLLLLFVLLPSASLPPVSPSLPPVSPSLASCTVCFPRASALFHHIRSLRERGAATLPGLFAAVTFRFAFSGVTSRFAGPPPCLRRSPRASCPVFQKIIENDSSFFKKLLKTTFRLSKKYRNLSVVFQKNNQISTQSILI